MQTPRQRCRRLIGALEELAAQETTILRAGDFSGLAEVQDRAAALIDDLMSHVAALDDELRERLRAIRQVRAHSAEWLEIECARARDGLAETGATQRRVAQFAPVYGGTAAPKARPQLSFVG